MDPKPMTPEEEQELYDKVDNEGLLVFEDEEEIDWNKVDKD